MEPSTHLWGTLADWLPKGMLELHLQVGGHQHLQRHETNFSIHHSYITGEQPNAVIISAWKPQI